MKLIALERVFFSDTQNPKAVFYHIIYEGRHYLSVNDKHYLLNRDNLTLPIQTQLYQKQKILSEFFFVFLKSILNFKIFTKKDDPRS